MPRSIAFAATYTRPSSPVGSMTSTGSTPGHASIAGPTVVDAEVSKNPKVLEAYVGSDDMSDAHH